MIVPGTRFKVALVPLTAIVVSEHQPRSLTRVGHYVRLLRRNQGHQLGPVTLAPVTGRPGLWTLLDGHHRYVAHVLAGRGSLLALCEWEPAWPGYGDLDATWQEVPA